MTESAPPPTSVGGDRGERLREQLRASADARGFVAFDRFMDVALYGAGVGFYAGDASPFGRTGDYYTAAHVTPLFGRALARRIRAAAASRREGGPFRVMEIGPGDGALAETIVAALGDDPELKDRIEYILVDRSPTLSALALERVASISRSTRIPVRAAGGIGTDGPFRGVVIANEVLDAQPARRLRWTGTRWEETGVRVTDTGLVPATSPLDRTVPGPELPRPTDAGTILEVSPRAEGIVREVADHLVAGRFIVLDYGMDESELLLAHPSGTLASVRRHRNVADPYSEPGRSDLSVFVNFTRVRDAARRSGLTEATFTRQAEALGTWGFPELLEEALRSVPSAEEAVRVRLAAKNLLFGFDRFYALELAAGEGAGPATALR